MNFETRRFPLGEERGTRNGSPAEAAATDQPAGRSPGEPDDTEESPAPEPGPVVASAGESANATESSADDERVMPPPTVTVEQGPDVKLRSGAEPDASPPAQKPAAGRYVVQVASLASEANARQLMTTLQRDGLPVLLDTVESDVGRLSRVRVGPYDTQADANDAVSRIRRLVDGVNPRLVDLQPDQAAAVTSPADPLVRWVVQVGSFSEPANAEGLVGQLRASGLSAYRETVTSAGSSIHRVRVGPYLERDDALAARQRLIDSHSLEGVVMSAD